MPEEITINQEGNYLESVTAYKTGWGSATYRWVGGLSREEKLAVLGGTAKVFFRFTPWHYTQSGIKIVTSSYGRYDSREPTDEELRIITMIAN